MTSIVKLNVTSSRPADRFSFMKAAVAWADENGPQVRQSLRDAAPVGKGPTAGRLARSIRYQRSTSGHGVRVEYTANTPYAGYVVGGTRPHMIYPVAARWLHWTDEGGQHFRKKVHHPGTKPNPFHIPVMERAQPKLEASFSEHMKRELGGI